jgi:hypothetical protein
MMIRRGGDDLLGRRPSVLGQRRTGTLGEDVLAAGDSISSEAQRIPLISGSSHSSK